MAKPDSWMPVYWADLWNKTRDLNAVEQCAYYNLLGSMWMQGASLPNDDARLQRMARVTEKEWRTVKATVIAFFDLCDGRYHQRRLTEEYEKAMKAYTARSEHMATVNSKRRQSKRTVTVTTTDDTTHNSHSSSDEMDANASTPKPAKPRRTRLAKDWQPSPDDYQFAIAANLGHAEIAADLIEFVGYWTGPEPAKPTKIDWSKTYRNHITDYAPRIIARRPRVGKSFADSKRGGGLASYLRESLVEEPLPDGPELSGFGSDVPDGADSTGGFGQGDSDSGSVVDADEWQRTAVVADEITDPHCVENRDGRGLETDDGDLSRAASSIPSGRGPVCSEIGNGQRGLVADMVEAQGTSGHIHEQTAPDASSDDGLDIPAFLRRTA